MPFHKLYNGKVAHPNVFFHVQSGYWMRNVFPRVVHTKGITHVFTLSCSLRSAKDLNLFRHVVHMNFTHASLFTFLLRQIETKRRQMFFHMLYMCIV